MVSYRQTTINGRGRLLCTAGPPTLRQAELLERLEQVCVRLDRSPTREELAPVLRLELTETFGSLRAALLVLGRSPAPRLPARRLRRKKHRAEKKAPKPTKGVE